LPRLLCEQDEEAIQSAKMRLEKAIDVDHTIHLLVHDAWQDGDGCIIARDPYVWRTAADTLRAYAVGHPGAAGGGTN
jgi:hypothetical protein